MDDLWNVSGPWGQVEPNIEYVLLWDLGNKNKTPISYFLKNTPKSSFFFNTDVDYSYSNHGGQIL